MSRIHAKNRPLEPLPERLQGHFEAYRPCVYDAWCGEPVGWGYEPRHRLGDALFSECGEYGYWHCMSGSYPPSWYLITRWLTLDEARKMYGDTVTYERGPRGGFRSMTVGDKRFAIELLDA